MNRNLTHIVITFVLSFVIAGCAIRNPNKYYTKAKNKYAPFDAIIVPGVPFEEDEGEWSRTMKLRVYWAKYLWDHNMTKNIIFSGGAVYTKYAECKIMRLYALKLGLPDEHIFLENQAEHSTENVYYSYWVAQKNGLDKIALATDPYQTKSLKSFVRKLNRKYDENVQLLPANIDTIRSLPRPTPEIEYSKAIGEEFINITETQGKLYRLGGTLGLHIDWKEKEKDTAK